MINDHNLSGLNVFDNYIYNVMVSDGNSFRGDVVLDIFNKVSRDEDNILDQIV